jgi:signal transduction histidine kinase
MPFSVLAKLWNTLTAPHASLTNIEERRKSQLLAGITLAVSLMTLVASVLMLARSGEMTSTIYGAAVGIVLCMGIYFANRAGYYRASAYAFIVQSVALVYGTPLITGTMEWLFFGVEVMIMSALLLPWSGTLAMFALNLILQIALIALHPMTANMTTFGVLIIFIVTAPLMLVFMNHRNHLETERQAELREANARLRESEVVLERRVEERTADLKVAKEQADAARERAIKADQIKSQFLASMSHELRTPLNAILNFTEMMSLEMAGPVNDQQKDLLVKSLDSAKHLLGLINDVLDVSKMQSGMMSLFVEDDINLLTELEQVSATAQSLLKDKPIRFVQDIDGDLPAISGDKRRIRQILLNLISNAAKFTEEGTITLSAKRRDANILFAVIDSGPGIAKDQQMMIFEPFTQTEAGIKHAGGTGLGLPISKHLAEAHGGRLWVESDLGEGTAFFVELPVKPRTLGNPGSEIPGEPGVKAAYALSSTEEGRNGRK